jgi:hypothetical protein
MTVQAGAWQGGARGSGKSVGAAVLGAILTLLIFVAVFVSFLIAPLALLLVAFLAWTVMKPRQGSDSAPAAGDGAAPGDDASYGFGAGAR